MLRACPTELHTAYDTALLDLDGVVYAGGEAVPHAVSSLAAARDGGMRLSYVTNNAARTPRTVAEHLSRLGVPASAVDVVTSAQAVARLIAEQVAPGGRVLCVGGEGLRVALVERGLTVVESADDRPVAVVQGYGGPELQWGRLAEASLAVGAGVPWFASNADLTIPSGRGIAPGNGAAVEVVRIATRWMRDAPEPQIAGKPRLPMHRETILRTGAERPLVVGDRLDTDIEGAYAGGVDSLLVLTGVTDATQLLAAVPEHRPTFIAADLRGLLKAHAEPTRERAQQADDQDGFGHDTANDQWTHGGWRVRPRAGEWELTGAGDPVDGLRALCSAVWSRADAAGTGGRPLDAGRAIGRLGL